MKTEFSPKQLENAQIATSEGAIRKCVHCGFCTATCPTYVLLGDELDSPRGRIYLIKEMLEKEQVPSPSVVKHIDRCLSCLSCTTTCPSGVDYMHLMDHARAYVQEHYSRPWHDQFYRFMLAKILPYRHRFKIALAIGRQLGFLDKLLSAFNLTRPLGAMLRLAQHSTPSRVAHQTSEKRQANRRKVILQKGCAEPVLKPEYQIATIRILERLGYEVIYADVEECCGALVHHMGREKEAQSMAQRQVDAWSDILSDDVVAILITASGCGVTIKDYGYLLKDEPKYAEKALRISELSKDVSEFLSAIDLPSVSGLPPVKVAYHGACSLQHGQQIKAEPKQLLERLGFCTEVPQESHLCCGSAGTYNILQSEIADTLGDRKVSHLIRLKADVIATSNIGCAVQIGIRTNTPVVHTVELVDWATGGPKPSALDRF